MGTLLNRRRYMGGASAQMVDIEYLQSDGNQWIELGIYGSDELDFIIDFEPLDLIETRGIWTGTGAYFGWLSYSPWMFFCLCGYNRDANHKGCFFYSNNGEGQGGSRSIGLLQQRQTVEKQGNTLYLPNGTTALLGGTYTTPGTIVAFACKNNSQIQHYGKMKLYSLKFSKNDVAILDLVPVRVGQVGYLYDKVSNTLFANEGSVGFTLGPDKT